MASIDWDDSALGRVVGTSPEVASEVESATRRIQSSAGGLSSGYRTGLYHRDHRSPAVGNTQPSYESDVRVMGSGTVGIVYTGNYAAMKDNAENNTLLKAMG